MNQSPLDELRATSNSTDLWDMWNVVIQREIQTDLAIAKQLMVAVRELQASINTRQTLINDAKTNLKDNKIAIVLFFIEMLDKEMACVRDLLVKIDEVLKRPVEKEEFLDYDTLPGETFNEMYMEEEEVVFKIHTKGYFEYDPLRYVNVSVSCVSAFTYDKDVFPRCLNHIMSKIDEHKWALFYRIPKKSVDKGLKLLHTDNDVHSFFDAAIKNGSIHFSTPFDTRFKRKIIKSKKTGVIHDEGAGRKRKKSLVNGGNKGKEKVFEDEGADKKRKKTLVNGGSKGKEKVFEDEGNEGVVIIYKRAMVNGKAKMVEVEGAIKTGRDIGVVIGGKEEVVKVESE
ncbi:hypothetical protein Tco_1060718 [Tanacetum coccineum]